MKTVFVVERLPRGIVDSCKVMRADASLTISTASTEVFDTDIYNVDQLESPGWGPKTYIHPAPVNGAAKPKSMLLVLNRNKTLQSL